MLSKANPQVLSKVARVTVRAPSKNIQYGRMAPLVNKPSVWTSSTSFVKSTNSLAMNSFRSFATGKVVKVPGMGDSISEGSIKKWEKNVGEAVKTDDIVANIETDKIVVDIRAPESGVLTELFAKEGDTVKVGADLFRYDPNGTATVAAKAEAPKAEAPKAEAPKQAPAAAPKAEAPKAEAPKPAAPAAPKPAAPKTENIPSGLRTENRVKMTRIRQRISERLKGAQNTYAMLTTFNEVDMTALTQLRNQYKDEFEKKHGIKLGFMSAFVKAAVAALQEVPAVNAVIEENEIVYRNYIDVSVAVSSPTGLVVPVIRDADKLSFAGVEKTLGDLGNKARTGSLAIEDMAGGTFTISNGGVFGSLFGTPIINPPQSAILGMHAVKNRAVVVGDQVVSRPMMYLALTYDHRLIDGREAVTFLKKVKETVEDPRRLLLDL